VGPIGRSKMTNSILGIITDRPTKQPNPGLALSTLALSGVGVACLAIVLKIVHGWIYYRVMLNWYSSFEQQRRLYFLWLLVAVFYWIACVIVTFAWGVLCRRKSPVLHVMRRLVHLSLGNLTVAALLATVATVLEDPKVEPSLIGIGFGFGHVLVLVLAYLFVIKGIVRLDLALTQEQEASSST